MSQRSFASAEFALKKKRTRREVFLAEMERVVPWARLEAVIEPLYPKSVRVGRQPIGVSRMLRMYCLQQWYGLADEALEDALYDSQALRDFVGIDLSRESVPDATTLLKFRRLLQDNDLTRALFDEFRRVGRTVLLGTVLTGLAQGLLATIGYFITRVPEAPLLGALTTVASLLPGVGTLLVWVPAGIYLLLSGHVGLGIAELVYGAAVVVGVSDYIIRPRLVGGHGEAPALLTFVALFGGLEVFGLIGLILGPVITSLAVALLRIYEKEATIRRAGEVAAEPAPEPKPAPPPAARPVAARRSIRRGPGAGAGG